MVEVKEVLRQWLAGTAKKRIAARLGLDVKTVRRYIEAAQEHGLSGDGGEARLTDELLTAVLIARRGAPGRPRGDSWALCEVNRERIAKMLRQGLRLSKLTRADCRPTAPRGSLKLGGMADRHDSLCCLPSTISTSDDLRVPLRHRRARADAGSPPNDQCPQFFPFGRTVLMRPCSLSSDL